MEPAPSLIRNRLFWFTSLLWLVVMILSLWCQPLMNDIDQPHYLSVAWEMWTRHHYLFAISNGLPDNNKPPLLYWFILGGWKLFGISVWWPRFLEVIIGWLCIHQVARLTKRLSGSVQAQWIVYLLMYGSYYWFFIMLQIRFDALLTLFTLVAITALWDFHQRYSVVSAFTFIVAITLGLFAKGPFIFVYLLPMALALPWTHKKRNFILWYLLIICFIAASFILPAIWLHYVQDELARDGLVHSVLHKVGGYLHLSFHLPFYIGTLLYTLLPWVTALPLWLALRHLKWMTHRDSYLYLLITLLSGFCFAVLLMSHQAMRYILTAVLLATAFLAIALSEYIMAHDQRHRFGFTWLNGATALLAALFFLTTPFSYRFVTVNFAFFHVIPWWFAIPALALAYYQFKCGRKSLHLQLCHAAIGVLCILMVYQVGFWRYYAPHFNLQAVAKMVEKAQQRGHPILGASYRLWPQRLEFLGRFPRAIPIETKPDRIKQWAIKHPRGYLVMVTEVDPQNPPAGYVAWQSNVNFGGRNLFKRKKLRGMGLCRAGAYLQKQC